MADLPVLRSELMPALAASLRSAADYAAAEKSAATRRAYRSDWLDYTAWCRGAGCVALPGAPQTIAAYLAALADAGKKASTIARRCAAIRYAHRLHGCDPSPTEAEPVKAVLRGIRRRIGVAVERKAPATGRAVGKMLKRIAAEIAAARGPGDVLRGKRDRALLLIGFAAALRRAELVELKVNDIERAADGVIVHIRRSKADQEGEGQSVAVPSGQKLKPVAALDEWLAALTAALNGNLPADSALFRAIGNGRGGAVELQALSGKSIADIVKRRAAAAGFDAAAFSGHSLRAGFVTTALEHNADLFRVMDVTRHREVKTLRAYDRRAKAFRNHAGKGFL